MSSLWPITVKDATGVVRVAGHAKGVPPAQPSPPLSAVANVSTAQLLGFTNPVPIVAGVGGQMIVPLGGVVEYVAGSTPFTDHGGDLVVYWNTGNGLLFNDRYFNLAGAGFWDQATSQVAPIFPNNGAQVQGNWAHFTDKDLAIGSHAVTGNPTGGNGRLVVTIFYSLVPVSP